MMECTQHLVVSRQSTSGDPLCHHPGITKNRCPGAQCRASSADSVGRRCQIMHDLGHTAGMDQPYSHVREVRKEEVQARFGTNDRKGLTVNVVAVTQVVNHVMLCTGFLAAAEVNVHRLIKANLLCEVVGEFEGMAGRIGGRSATTPVPGTCHQRAPGMCRRVMQSQLFDGLMQGWHTLGEYIGNKRIL